MVMDPRGAVALSAHVSTQDSDQSHDLLKRQVIADSMLARLGHHDCRVRVKLSYLEKAKGRFLLRHGTHHLGNSPTRTLCSRSSHVYQSRDQPLVS